jgi:hypothetical protein
MTNESVISVPRDEFNRDLLALHNRVFSQAEDSLILEDMLRPFVDSSWEAILVPGDIFTFDGPGRIRGTRRRGDEDGR